MKKYSLLFLFILPVISGFAQLNSFKFKRKLDKVESPGFYSIKLLPEITANSLSNLRDIRLYNITEKDTIEIPYLFLNEEEIQKKTIPFIRINDVKNQKCCSYLTLKIEGKRVLNSIHLNVSQNNFDKRLTLEGSNDNVKWFVIKERIRVVGFSDGYVNFKSTNLSFLNTEYSYFRIKMDDDGSEAINIIDAEAFEYEKKEAKRESINIKKWEQIENKTKKQTDLIIEFDKPYFIYSLKLFTDSIDNFYRNINIYTLDETIKTQQGLKEYWRLISTDVFSSKKDNYFVVNNYQTNKIKITIFNNDNQPVKINDVQSFVQPKQLIAQLPASDNIYLCYGKTDCNSPMYDLAHFRNEIPKEPELLGYGKEEIKLESLAKKSGLIENKIWLWVALGLLIVIIGYFALKMLNNPSSEG